LKSNGKNAKKIGFAPKGLHSLSEAFCVAKEMGKSMGRGKIL